MYNYFVHVITCTKSQLVRICKKYNLISTLILSFYLSNFSTNLIATMFIHIHHNTFYVSLVGRAPINRWNWNDNSVTCIVNVRKEIVSLVGVNVEGGKLCATLGVIFLCHVATSKHSWFLEWLGLFLCGLDKFLLKILHVYVVYKL
jgi:hypothetical protein